VLDVSGVISSAVQFALRLYGGGLLFYAWWCPQIKKAGLIKPAFLLA